MKQIAGQMVLFDFGIMDRYDCGRCVWKRDHGECYPDKTLHRQYFYNTQNGRYCSDYCTAYASVAERRGK